MKHENQPGNGDTIFLALLGILALGGMLTILLPFVGPIIMGGAIAITAYPVHLGMGRRWPGLSPVVRSLLINLVILMLFILPVFFLARTAAGQVDTIRPVLARWVEASQAIHRGRLNGPFSALRPIPDVVARQSGMSAAQATALLLPRAARGFDKLAEGAGNAAADLFQGALCLVLCPLITFFLLVNGPEYVERLSGLLPLRAEDRRRLFERTRDATIAVVRGLFLTALLETAVATLGYALMGIPCAVLLGVLTGFASIVPVIGTSSVWVPAGLAMILAGQTVRGGLVLVWGTGMVLLIDNVAAPWLVGHRIRMSLLPMLFGMLGGAAVFGVKGLLIGPLIMSISPTVFELIRIRVISPRKKQMNGGTHE